MYEMQCYCEKEHKKKLENDTSCDNTINYTHHREWSYPEDYVCEECLKTYHADL